MKVKSIAVATILTLLLVSMIPVGIQASPAAGITIDGVLTEGEWDGATSFQIGPCVGYVTNDEQYMYVAYNYGIKTEGEWANIITYRAGLTPEKTYISWVFVRETLEPQLWAVQDTHTVTVDGKRGEEKPDGLFTPFSTDPLALVDTVRVFGKNRINLVYAVASATEMGIPLTELGLTPGDSIKIMPGINTLPNTIFVYPDAGSIDPIEWSQDPNNYADYTLWAPPQAEKPEKYIDIEHLVWDEPPFTISVVQKVALIVYGIEGEFMDVSATVLIDGRACLGIIPVGTLTLVVHYNGITDLTGGGMFGTSYTGKMTYVREATGLYETTLGDAHLVVWFEEGEAVRTIGYGTFWFP